MTTRSRTATAARRAGVLGVVLGLLAIYLAGCFTADAKLEADGTGTVDLTYPVDPKAKPEAEKARWSSAHVTLKSFTPKGNNQAQVVVAFDDVTQLSSADGFVNVAVTKTRDGDDDVVKIVIKNPKPNPTAKDANGPDPVLKVTFPGAVKEANRNGKVSGNTVTWSPPLLDMIREPALDFTARYPAPAGDAKKPDAKASDAKTSDAKPAETTPPADAKTPADTKAAGSKPAPAKSGKKK